MILKGIAIAWTLFCLFGCVTAYSETESAAASFITWALIWAVVGIAIVQIGKLFTRNTRA